MDNRFSNYIVLHHRFGQRIKVLSGLAYNIRKTLTDNVLTYQQYVKEPLDDLAPDDFEFEYGRYSTENNLDLLRARENTRRVISEQQSQQANEQQSQQANEQQSLQDPQQPQQPQQ